MKRYGLLLAGPAVLAAALTAWGATRLADAADEKNLLPPAPAVDWEQSGDRASVVFAAGCFWCVEAVFEPLDGVEDVVSGYAGGSAADAKYDLVAAGRTDHAEAVQIVYDPGQITYGRLLQVLYATHDPTTPDRQGPDYGAQYRGAVFYADDDQKRVTQAYIDQLDDAGTFAAPIVTSLEPLGEFYPAEAYHQDFVEKNPDHPYVVRYALPKIEKVEKNFSDLLSTPTTRPN